MQSGMLYQYLLADGSPERGGYDIEQIRITVNEALDQAALAAAWTQVAHHYPALSSRFRWKDVPSPRQIPQRQVIVPVDYVDWRDGEPEQLREAFLQADRRRGFDLGVAPLMRVTVARLAESQYELFWTFHHILIDGRSFAHILHEVFTVYSAKLSGRTVTLPAESKSFADYIAWHSRHDHRASLVFFKQLLAGKQAPTPLPLAEPAGRALSASGYGTALRTPDVTTLEALKALAQRHQTTLGGVLQVAWGLLLSRLTGDNDVVYGIARSCRYSALDGAAESTVGLFINTLPARIHINEQDHIGTLLAVTRQQWIAQRNHDQTPLIDVHAQSEFGRGVPLFETLLMYDNRELNQTLVELNPAWQTRHCTLYEQPSTPLTLTASDGNTLQLRLLYDRRRYSTATAERLGDYLLNVLDTMTRAVRVADVDVLSAADRKQILYGWNDTQAAYDDTQLIHQLFEARADQMPTAPALVADGQTMTFAEVEQRANRLANALRARGMGPGCYVGLCLSRGANLVIAMLGIAKSGAAYVPIDTDYPAERIAFVLEDTAATLVVSEPGCAALLNRPALHLDDATVSGASSARPAPLAQPTDICYSIYTSGSTGKPKGVILTHRAVVNTLEWVSRSFAVGPGDRALFVTSPCFDLSVYDVFGVLGAGGTVVVSSAQNLREPRELVQQLTEQRITIWDSAPAALQRLAALFPHNGGTQLRLVMLSGDWIPLTLPDAVRKSFPAAQVISLGGATEAAIWSNWFAVGAIDPRWTSIPYGRPIQNAQYYVLDSRRQPVPAGVTGDLYISGACLAQGYLNRPELTAERFVTNPFRPGERMYLTGDLARYFANGELEFLGRADFQVKIRGYRVELGEVEAALLALPNVRDAVCSAFTDVSGAKALVAYLTAKEQQRIDIDIDMIKTQLRKSLPDFMVPSRIMVLRAMPLSANGKLDRKALPSPLDADTAADSVAPRTRDEKKMAIIWRRLLKSRQVGVDDNFFDLGGDSLLAVSLALEIEKKFRTDFPLARILEFPTLGTMAAAVTSNRATHKHLVTLNVGASTRPPLFLFSGGGGFGFFYHDLAKQLGPDQPVHVLNAIGTDDESEIADHSIEEMAAIYEPQILAVSASGPVILGGYSFGAMLAYEMARRLKHIGIPVPLVISFDGPAPGYPQKQPLLQRLWKHTANWTNLNPTARREYLLARWQNIKQRLKRQECNPLLSPVSGIDPELEQRLRRVSVYLARARSRFKPNHRIRSSVLLLKAEHPFEWPGHATDALYGWGKFAVGAIEVITLPGSHLELFGEENNALMAETIARLVAQP